MNQPESQVWRPPRGLRIFSWIATVIFAVVWFFSLGGLVVAEGPDGRSTAVAFMVLFGLLGAYVCIQTLRPSLEARPDRLIVQNPYRRYEIAWDDIVKITPGDRGLRIARQDQPAVSARAVQKSTWGLFRDSEEHADDVLTELAELAEQRGGLRSSESIEPTTEERAALSRSARVAIIFGLGLVVAWYRVRNNL